MVEVGGGGRKGGDGLCGQRSGSLASRGVYRNTGCVLVDKLMSWVFVLRNHNFPPKYKQTSDSESVEGKVVIKDCGYDEGSDFMKCPLK